ncbi:MAG TPA: FAD-binding oxidoreductase [Verrucomicrobiales bacterium]|nr:FAD-binding oxidoreductase [Verrucomicrobiales bacterium]
MELSESQRKQLSSTECDIRWDETSRELYSFDASIYRIRPAAVAFPNGQNEAASAVEGAAAAGIPVVPRGAGTGLAGGALGKGLVIDYSKHNRNITEFHRECGSVRVDAGVVLDQLNQFLQPTKLCFGPDVATSSRDTLGGMIANNSSGARAPFYGCTGDHVLSLDILTSDGRIHRIGKQSDFPDEKVEQLQRLAFRSDSAIRQRPRAALVKRWPGFSLEPFLNDPGNLCHLLAGSEGILASVLSAELALSPLPEKKALALVFFDDLEPAMEAAVKLKHLDPVAIEHIDRILLDQTRGLPGFQQARRLMSLDERPCESLLMVEFYDHQVEPGLNGVQQLYPGVRSVLLRKPDDMNAIWFLRKAGLSLLTSCPGPAKPTTGIEDVVVRPEQLPAYARALKGLLHARGLKASFYGHAASGLLHVRPVLNLHRREDVVHLKALADEVSQLTLEFKGSLAGEHGIGIARSAYMKRHLGEEILNLHRDIRSVFDPNNLMNPGKILEGENYSIDRNLRHDPEGREVVGLPSGKLLFRKRDHSFQGNLEQCNGCGHCRKDAPTMCPTFSATGEEGMSTRGRANIISSALSRHSSAQGTLLNTQLLDILGHCLSCKACARECPSSVDLASLKAELLYEYHKNHGPHYREWAVASYDKACRIASLMPRLSNRLLHQKIIKKTVSALMKITPQRSFPSFAPERFDHWFNARSKGAPKSRGPIILWDDTFVRYHDVTIGQAAVTVLEAAGFEVHLPVQRRCCGRPAFSQGYLDSVDQDGRYNVGLLKNLLKSLQEENASDQDIPILFLEPSCWSMFIDDYLELGIPDSEEISKHCILFESFIGELLANEPDSLLFNPLSEPVLVHQHCHSQVLLESGEGFWSKGHLPQGEVKELNTGCCGMAGAFGYWDKNYELSVQVATPLIEALDREPDRSSIVACGASCRHQIEHLTERRPVHTAEILCRSLVVPQ